LAEVRDDFFAWSNGRVEDVSVDFRDSPWSFHLGVALIFSLTDSFFLKMDKSMRWGSGTSLRLIDSCLSEKAFRSCGELILTVARFERDSGEETLYSVKLTFFTGVVSGSSLGGSSSCLEDSELF